VYIGEKLQPLCSADYMCNFFLVCFIFDGGCFVWKGVGRGASIVFYMFGYFVVVEDSTLSVSGGGTPITHSLGWRGGGVKTGSNKRFMLKSSGNA
jgi:hypothetical protein